MDVSVFQYQNYKNYLDDLILSLPKKGRGIKSKMAEFIKCQNTYITHVLSGDAQLSLEQAEGLSRFFEMNERETRFFLILVQKERAGTETLRQYLQKDLDVLVEENSNLRSRVKIDQEIKEEHKLRYYGDWKYMVIHMALLIPGLGNIPSLSEKFNLTREEILEVLNFLEEVGLVLKSEDGYSVTEQTIHLEKRSPFIPLLHGSWRLKAIEQVKKDPMKNLHYSLCFTCAKADQEKIKERLLKAIEECAELIKPSKDEEVMALNLDIFSL